MTDDPTPWIPNLDHLQGDLLNLRRLLDHALPRLDRIGELVKVAEQLHSPPVELKDVMATVQLGIDRLTPDKLQAPARLLYGLTRTSKGKKISERRKLAHQKYLKVTADSSNQHSEETFRTVDEPQIARDIAIDLIKIVKASYSKTDNISDQQALATRSNGPLTSLYDTPEGAARERIFEGRNKVAQEQPPTEPEFDTELLAMQLPEVFANPMTVGIGDSMELGYGVYSRSKITTPVWLGAILFDDEQNHFDDKEGLRSVKIGRGLATYVRPFSIDSQIHPGSYWLLLALWYGRPGDSNAMCLNERYVELPIRVLG